MTEKTENHPESILDASHSGYSVHSTPAVSIKAVVWSVFLEQNRKVTLYSLI